MPVLAGRRCDIGPAGIRTTGAIDPQPEFGLPPDAPLQCFSESIADAFVGVSLSLGPVQMSVCTPLNQCIDQCIDQ